jgi:hypothetical protein
MKQYGKQKYDHLDFSQYLPKITKEFAAQIVRESMKEISLSVILESWDFDPLSEIEKPDPDYQKISSPISDSPP